MPKDPPTRFSALQEVIRRQENMEKSARKAIELNDRFQKLINEMNRSQEMMCVALGPMEDLRRAIEDMQTPALKEAAREAQETAERLKASFYLPELEKLSSLYQQLETGPTGIIREYLQRAEDVRQAMAAMRTPWVNLNNQLNSVTGFAKLQGIGHVLRTGRPFDDHISDLIRQDLGDWRTEISWPPEIFTDPLARAHFYKDRGLDSDLTAFPPAAFQQSLELADLVGMPPPLRDRDNAIVNEEAAFQRTNTAHDWLMRFEVNLRHFINQVMKQKFGDNWVKNKVPGDVLQSWKYKRQRDIDQGISPRAMIEYADFGDYEKIILRRDNWEDVFESFFGHKTYVQESFRRLYPVRICTMHALLITQDDELYLRVEVRRFMKTIGYM